jgi:hypothetical protein
MSELLQHYKEPFIQLALRILMNKELSSTPFDTSNTNTSNTNTSNTKTSNTKTSNTNTSNASTFAHHTSERNTSERNGFDIGLNASTSNTSCVDLSHTWPASSHNEDQSDRSRVRKRGFATSPRDFQSKKRQRPSNSRGEDNSQLDKQANETSVHSARSPSIQASRFACPYFKHDPKEFGKRGACSGPGWESVHRLK